MPRRPALLPVLLLVLAAALVGCGAAPPKIGPTGVDELEIPTPSPRPADFGDGVDHPLLPLAPGSRWEYAVSGDDDVVRRTVTVLDGSRVVAGIAATGVHQVETDESGEVVHERSTWFAQDLAGNVWALAGEITDQPAWEAGRDGAEAGIAMLGSPRMGDGYVTAFAEGVVDDRIRIVTVGQEVTVPFGSFTEVLETERTSPLEPDVTVRHLHAGGVGPVKETVLETGRTVELVEFARG